MTKAIEPTERPERTMDEVLETSKASDVEKELTRLLSRARGVESELHCWMEIARKHVPPAAPLDIDPGSLEDGLYGIDKALGELRTLLVRAERLMLDHGSLTHEEISDAFGRHVMPPVEWEAQEASLN